MNLNFLQKNSSGLPGNTPQEKLAELVTRLNQDPEIGYMEKAQINMGFGAIKSILPEDPEEALKEMRQLLGFIAGLFNYEVVLVPPGQMPIAQEQIDQLAAFILEYFPEEIGDEGAVEVAVRLLSKKEGACKCFQQGTANKQTSESGTGACQPTGCG